MRIHLPKTSASRREKSYVRLIRAVTRHDSGLAFVGKLFAAGAAIDDAELWPDDEWPSTPLALEFAGRAEVGRGHNRSSWLYVLWRYDDGEWQEIARTVAVGAEWVEHLRPIALAELRAGRSCPAEAAARVSGKVLVMLDSELDRLPDEERRLAMALVYEQFTARLVEFA